MTSTSPPHRDGNDGAPASLTTTTVVTNNESRGSTPLDASLFECPICLSMVFEPAVTPCGHLFCFMCVYHSMSSFQSSSCPVCRQSYGVLPAVSLSLHHFLYAVFPDLSRSRSQEIEEGDNPALGITRSKVLAPPSFCVDDDSSEDAMGGGHDRHLARVPEIMKCEVCKSLPYKSVVLATCGHTFCLWCIYDVITEVSKEDGQEETVLLGLKCPSLCPRADCRIRILAASRHCLPLSSCLESLLPDEYKRREEYFSTKDQQLVTLKQRNADKYPERQNDNTWWSALFITPASSEAMEEVVVATTTTSEDDGGDLTESSTHQDGGAGGVAVPSGQNEGANEEEAVASTEVAEQDETFVHMGVGCDVCGMSPVTGRRYRCSDCPEAFGYDLCGACYDAASQSSGRFHQSHTPEHTVVLMPQKKNIIQRIQEVRPDLNPAQIMRFLDRMAAQATDEEEAENNEAEGSSDGDDHHHDHDHDHEHDHDHDHDHDHGPGDDENVVG